MFLLLRELQPKWICRTDKVPVAALPPGSHGFLPQTPRCEEEHIEPTPPRCGG